jgi:hypothetical protein
MSERRAHTRELVVDKNYGYGSSNDKVINSYERVRTSKQIDGREASVSIERKWCSV